MPEPRPTKCPECHFVYDLTRSPTCPNCRKEKAQDKQEIEERRRRIRERRTMAETETFAKKGMSYLYLVAACLFGAVGFMMLINYRLELPLFSIPVIEKKQTIVVKQESPPEPKEAPSDVCRKIVTLRTELNEDILKVVSWKRGEPGNGKIPYSGQIQNIGPTLITQVNVRLKGRNSSGKEIRGVSGRLAPAYLQPLEVGKFELNLPADDSIRTVDISADWSILYDKQLATVPLSEMSSPPLKPGEEPRKTTLVVKPAGGGDPLIIGPDDIREPKRPPTAGEVEWRRKLEEARKAPYEPDRLVPPSAR